MKTLRKSKLLTVLLAVFMSLCTFIGILATPRPASADSTNTVDTSNFYEKPYDDSAVGGKYIRVYNLVDTSALLYFSSGDAWICKVDGVWKLCYRANSKTDDLGFECINQKGTTYTFYFSEEILIEGVELSSLSLDYDREVNPNLKMFELVPFVTAGWQEVEYDGTAPAGRYFKVTPYDRQSMFVTNYLFLDETTFAIQVDTSQGVEPYLTFDGGKVDASEYGIEFIDWDYYHFVVYFAEDCNLEAYGRTWNASTDSIVQAISSSWNCYTTELIKPTENQTGSGGSSLNRGNKYIDNLDVVEIISLIGVAVWMLMLLIVYAFKVPNSKAKFIILLVLIAGFMIAEGALYLYFI